MTGGRPGRPVSGAAPRSMALTGPLRVGRPARTARSRRPSRRSATRRRPAAGSTPARRTIEHVLRQPLALRAEHEDDVAVDLQLRQRVPPRGTSATRVPRRRRRPRIGTRKIAPIDARSAFGPVGSAQPVESATAGAERVGGAQQRPDVPRVGDVPERERDRPRAARQLVAPVDARSPAADARASRPPRAAPARRPRPRPAARRPDPARVDEVLALDDEQAELVAPAPLVQLADELQLLVVARGDHRRASRRATSDSVRARPSPARRSRRTRPDR